MKEHHFEPELDRVLKRKLEELKNEKSSPKMKLKSPILLYFNGEMIELKSDGYKRYTGTDGVNVFTIFGIDLEVTL